MRNLGAHLLRLLAAYLSFDNRRHRLRRKIPWISLEQQKLRYIQRLHVFESA